MEQQKLAEVIAAIYTASPVIKGKVKSKDIFAKEPKTITGKERNEQWRKMNEAGTFKPVSEEEQEQFFKSLR